MSDRSHEAARGVVPTATLQIRRRSAGEERSPIAHLVDCHARIRTHLALAARLAAEEAAQRSLDERKAAGAQLVRYFTVALPLHAEDEERSLAPRLVALAPSTLDAAGRLTHERALACLSQLADEHRAIDAAIAELLPAWQTGECPSQQLAAATAQLDALLRAHIESEEASLFPAALLLGPERLRQLVSEAQQRRGG